MPSRLLTIPALAVVALLAAKQMPAQLAVYGMGSGIFLGSGSNSGGFSSFGYTVGIYDDFARLGPLKLGGDARYLQSSSSRDSNYNNEIRGALIGPRLSLALPLIPFKPYVQAEVGDIATNYGEVSNLPNALTYQLQGGLDFTIFPHVDLRAEYGGGQIKDYGTYGTRTVQEVGLGAVVRF